MSPIVSRSPSVMNQSKEAFWMSIRLGRSRTCFRREKLFRARREATLLVKNGDLRSTQGRTTSTGTALGAGRNPDGSRRDGLPASNALRETAFADRGL